MAWPPEANEDLEAMRGCKSKHTKTRAAIVEALGLVIRVCVECGWEVRPNEAGYREQD